MIRVLIVDDNSFLREALASLLRSVDGIAVVGECADGAEVLVTAADAGPDLVLMDLDMPITSGLEATRQLTAVHPATRVVILTGSSPTVTAREAAEAGAVGYLTKGCRPERLVEAVRTVAAGGTAWPTGAPSFETVRATSG
jgi:DNA-binding NarL/FixJ family response regulator